MTLFSAFTDKTEVTLSQEKLSSDRVLPFTEFTKIQDAERLLGRLPQAHTLSRTKLTPGCESGLSTVDVHSPLNLVGALVGTDWGCIEGCADGMCVG